MSESSDIKRRTLFADLSEGIRLPKMTKLLSLGFGVILLTWLAAQLDLVEALRIFRRLPPGLLIGGFVCYALAFYLRALRFGALLPPEYSRRHLFPIVLVHYAALNIIPARLGELSYIYLLKKVKHVPTGISVSNLLLARVFDQLTISVLFLASSYVLELSSPWLQAVRLGVCGLLVAVCALLAGVLAYKDIGVRQFERLLHRLRLDRYALVGRLLTLMRDIVAALNTVRITQHVARVAGLSLLIWLSIFGHNYCLLHAFQVELSYAGVIWASTCLILLSALPIHVLSGIGVHEISWVFLALELGIPKNVAITSAFGSRLLSILYLAIFGGYGLLRLQKILERQAAQS